MAYASWSVVFGEQPSATKWNILGTNDSGFNDGTAIGNGAIKPVHLATGLSSSIWAWTSYTPTWTNLTVGNAVQSSKWAQIGKTVVVRLNLVWGSTTSVSGSIIFSLPVTAAANYTSFQALGTINFNDTSALLYPATAVYTSTTTSTIFFHNPGAGSVFFSAASSTTPFTWTTGDGILGTLVYEAA